MTLLRHIPTPIKLILLICAVNFQVSAQTYEVEEVTFNSKHGDFAPIKFEDGVVFCSSRNQKKLVGDIDSTRFYTDMFFARLSSNRKFSEATLFSSDLTGILNEGPAAFTKDFSTIYYTANLTPDRKPVKGTVTSDMVFNLGIFSAKKINGKWRKKKILQFPSIPPGCDMAHPALSPNDSILYFTSNMAGGFGGSDIYYCIWKNGKWSSPINAGATINTAGDEVFPFHSKNGLFYFSTNGRHTDKDRKDMDIFSTRKGFDGEWMNPKPLPSPLNSTANDYSYCEFTNENFGFISSDRNQKDRIYSFSKSTPQFLDCEENQRTVLCYELEDSKIEHLQNTPLRYEWNLGDGTIINNFNAQHCYEKPGRYKISLSIIDTVTNQRIMNVSETVLEIKEYEQPYILSNDSVKVNYPIVFFCDDSSIKKYKASKHYWIIDNEYTFEGEVLHYAFSKPGWHSVLCGAVSEGLPGGEVLKSCSVKHIFVFDKDLPGFPQLDPDPTVEPTAKITLRSQFDGLSNNKLKKNLYRIVIEKSQARLPMNYPGFQTFEQEIVETKDSTGIYTYSIGASAEISRIYDDFKEIQEQALKTLSIESFDQENFGKEYLRTGKYIEPGNAEALNVEFNRLKDIKFEYNSAVIEEESFDNLDYIAAMLLLENDFTLKINAHTCSQGTHEYNQSLSEKRAQSVRDYFIAKGIKNSRLITKGYSETQPIASNDTEDGKSLNRRVEFIIIFNTTND
ncbi:MAG: OmpA family protein [Flavobacteriales bacterium]|jgi:outer membrane protein OmpA-like peptidoglycan-associated protein